MSVRDIIHTVLNTVINWQSRHVRAAERSRLRRWSQKTSDGNGIRYDGLEGMLSVTIITLVCNVKSQRAIEVFNITESKVPQRPPSCTRLGSQLLG